VKEPLNNKVGKPFEKVSQEESRVKGERDNFWAPI
jgi:hypothetical protein